jgi:hypothetical protein
MAKLSEALKSKVKRLAKEVGQRLAEKAGSIAQSWGHASAFLWKMEHSFIRYLTIMYMNTPSIYTL